MKLPTEIYAVATIENTHKHLTTTGSCNTIVSFRFVSFPFGPNKKEGDEKQKKNFFVCDFVIEFY